MLILQRDWSQQGHVPGAWMIDPKKTIMLDLYDLPENKRCEAIADFVMNQPAGTEVPVALDDGVSTPARQTATSRRSTTGTVAS